MIRHEKHRLETRLSEELFSRHANSSISDALQLPAESLKTCFSNSQFAGSNRATRRAAERVAKRAPPAKRCHRVDPNAAFRALRTSSTALSADPLDASQLTDLALATSGALSALMTGAGTRDDLNTLAIASNLSPILCEAGLGIDEIDDVKTAQDAVVFAIARGKRTGRFGLAGAEIRPQRRADGPARLADGAPGLHRGADRRSAADCARAAESRVGAAGCGSGGMSAQLQAPFPYFGGKRRACSQVWQALGNPANYVEPFCGSAAMLLGRDGVGKYETINDADGQVANFWRAIAHDAGAVADAADWPCNEADLFARHSHLVRHGAELLNALHGDPDYYDAKLAGWWVWGLCNWIGSGWCSGQGPWVHDGAQLVKRAGGGVQGINRQLPHMSEGQGINQQLPRTACSDTTPSRSEFIHEWFSALQARMRNVRVACGDWQRVTKPSVTTYSGLTGVFLDPPYTKGAMDYAANGTGGALADEVRTWCHANGGDPLLRIVLCGHAGEHDALLADGWHLRTWTAKKGYATTDEARANSKDETLWCSPHCVPLVESQAGLFAEVFA